MADLAPAGLVTGKSCEVDTCVNPAVWGGTLCAEHGGLSAAEMEKVSKNVDAFLSRLNPAGLVARSYGIIDVDISHFFGPDGRLLGKNDWPPGAARAVKRVTVRRIRGENGHEDKIIDIELVDQQKYMAMLMKQSGQLIERLDIRTHTEGKLDVRHTITEDAKDDLFAAMKRANLRMRPTGEVVDVEAVDDGTVLCDACRGTGRVKKPDGPPA